MNGRYSRTEAELLPPIATKTMDDHRGIIVHHTAGNTPHKPEDSPEIWRRVQSYHLNQKLWNDIGYNWGFDQFGQIFEGRGWGIHGAHSGGLNRSHHGIVYLGFGIDRPDEAGLDALGALICEHDDLYGKGEVFAHRDVSATQCPGQGLYDYLVETYGDRNPYLKADA